MLATQQNYFTAHSDPDQAPDGGFYTSHLESPGHGTATADGSIEFSFGYASKPNALEELLKRLGVLERIEADDPDFKLENSDGGGRRSEQDRIIRPYIEAAFQEHSRAEIMAILEDLGMMHAPVHDYGTMFADEGVLEQGSLVEVDHPTRGPTKQVGDPMEAGRHCGRDPARAPYAWGAHGRDSCGSRVRPGSHPGLSTASNRALTLTCAAPCSGRVRGGLALLLDARSTRRAMRR